ncbi:MAG: hypothetical protein ABI177_02310 [Edaphobacter sp.]
MEVIAGFKMGLLLPACQLQRNSSFIGGTRIFERHLLSEDIKGKSKWTRRKKVLAIVAVIIALVAIPQFVYLFMQSHAANQIFTTFSKALVAKDYQRAYNLTSSEFQSVTSEQAFVSQQESLCSDLGGLEEITEGSYETQRHSEGWSSDISARFVCKRAEKQVDFTLKKQGNGWKVYGYRER